MSEQIAQGTSFEFKICNPTMLKEAVSTISEIVQEATFSIDEEGIVFRGMDPIHVCLIDLRSPNADYEKWQIKQAGNFGIQTEEFNKILKQLKKTDSIAISYDGSQQINLKTSRMNLNLKAIETYKADTPLPKLSYNTKIILTGKEFYDILKQISNVSEYIIIQSYNNRIVFSGESEQGNVKIELEKGDPNLIELDMREESNTKYSIEYLLAFVKHVKNHALTLDFSTKMPMRINVHLGQVTQMDYYLAPRVEN